MDKYSRSKKQESDSLFANGDMDTIRKILERLCFQTDMETAIIQRKRDGNQSFWCRYDARYQQLTFDSDRYYYDVCSKIRDGLNPIVIQDVHYCQNGAWKNLLLQDEIGSFISFPLVDKDGILFGNLYFLSSTSSFFDKKIFTQMMAIYCDIIIVNFASISGIQKLRERLDIELEYSKNRDIILLSLAHDLQNPISSVLILSQFLKYKASSYKLNEIAGKIVDASLRMKNMIDDILDFNKMKLGSVAVLNCESVRVEKLIEEIISEFSSDNPRLLIKNIKTVPPIVCDRSKIGRAFSNLIGNSYKYGKKGGSIEISSFLDNNNYVFTIENEVDLISTTDLAELFLPFARKSKGSGLGLGLFITKQIAEIHGGGVAVSSNKGKIMFTLSIPCTHRL